MNRFPRSRASVALVLALAGAASGCEIIANFDRSKIDAGPTEEDAAAYDATYPEGDGAQPPVEAGSGDAGSDASTTDSSANDSAANDSAVNDSGHIDASAADSSSTDSSAADSSDSATAADSADTSTDDAAAANDDAGD